MRKIMLLFGGESLVELLAPQAGEKILDLGCGTGELTARIAQSGAFVQGIDSSKQMIDTARVNHPRINFSVEDARDFHVEEPLDAVFSHEVLHWIKEPDAVINCVEQALQPGGRFVAEFNWEGYVGAIICAHLSVVLSAISGQEPEAHNPWYCPSIDEYAGLLQQHGFDVREAVLVEPPTPPVQVGMWGLESWIQRFAGEFWGELSEDVRSHVINQVAERWRPALDRNGNWIADYRRIRVRAIKNSSR
ncbi:class I SAM-dependent methyltransferase [Microcoleus sp. B6-A1]|uniref:class I SAM-dependent methyltransferase n=1 Tax=Microcoleus sp. B6-A1 TaxID=2818684 RepID=UPI002FD2D654